MSWREFAPQAPANSFLGGFGAGGDERPALGHFEPDSKWKELKQREKPVWLEGKVAIWSLNPVSIAKGMHAFCEGKPTMVSADMLKYRIRKYQVETLPDQSRRNLTRVADNRLNP